MISKLSESVSQTGENLLEMMSHWILSQGAVLDLRLLHTASTLYMLGLIYFVQLVHYPLFALVGPKYYLDYHQKHVFWTTWAVGPAMILEALTSGALLLLSLNQEAIGQAAISQDVMSLNQSTLWMGLLLLLVIWLSTALLQVPCHNRLVNGFDPKMHHRLVKTNWIKRQFI